MRGCHRPLQNGSVDANVTESPEVKLDEFFQTIGEVLISCSKQQDAAS